MAADRQARSAGDTDGGVDLEVEVGKPEGRVQGGAEATRSVFLVGQRLLTQQLLVCAGYLFGVLCFRVWTFSVCFRHGPPGRNEQDIDIEEGEPPSGRSVSLGTYLGW